MINERTFLKIPYEFKEKFLVYPPSVKEVIHSSNYSVYKRIFTVSYEELVYNYTKEGKDIIPTPFEHLLLNCMKDKQYERLAKDAFFFFTKQKISFLYDKKLIVIGGLQNQLKNVKKVEDLVTLNGEEFFDFQNLIRLSVGSEPIEAPDPNEHPRITKMKAKARYRDQIKEKGNKKDSLTLASSLICICCMGIGLTPLNIGDVSFAAINELMKVYQGKEKYHIDIASLQAGAKKKDVHPKYWITNV